MHFPEDSITVVRSSGKASATARPLLLLHPPPQKNTSSGWNSELEWRAAASGSPFADVLLGSSEFAMCSVASVVDKHVFV